VATAPGSLGCRALFRTASLGALLAMSPALVADVTRGEILGSGCTGCHGTDGMSVAEAIPSIAGLDKFYFARVMVQYKNGERPATIMDRIAKGYTDSELREMAKYFGSLPWRRTTVTAAPEPLDEPRRLHEAACEECHERAGRHQDKDTPRIAGQAPAYVYLSLLQYRAKDAKLPQPEKMLKALDPLSDEQLRALSHFYASQD
jgi:sulfide dehydrogenase cytochrome subunit